ncbi:MAG TPA: ATP-binding cassette domain-containing protein [Bacteroidales bacterium]|jgi:ABC-2 type transport system ATP-binding protein|nr:ATP-binding cassette domain-containing protein [Bacteroidales bacterium]HOS71449.1 ATP-binding cassette domain-containing protein [Bacteroidales bacterium]HQH25055.1 ATP-binding cassette domain-containing protein [Bacteroidales bacterium]HQJ82421.1 ATP-binding cassette domain-containing protein [Bacteroidales bacterium]
MDIVIENLTKRYGVQKAVDNISLRVATGEILGFLGPNGAGKTTTMKIITNFITADEGEVYIGGRSLRDDPLEIKRHIGYLPENNPLYQEMPVIDYLEFCALINNIEKHRVAGRVAEMIRITGLNSEKHKKIAELSKGYRQRVGLAQAMIHDPEILILDEPTSGLDPNQIAEIRKLIRELGREKTVILSTHILPEVEATCDRIFIINKGRLVADGTAESLRKKAQGSDILRVRIEDGDIDQIFKALQSLKAVSMVDFADRQKNRFDVHCRSEEVKRDIFRLCVERNWVLTEITPFETRLEDIFRELTMN